jgi:hypothetical protein
MRRRDDARGRIPRDLKDDGRGCVGFCREFNYHFFIYVVDILDYIFQSNQEKK